MGRADDLSWRMRISARLVLGSLHSQSLGSSGVCRRHCFYFRLKDFSQFPSAGLGIKSVSVSGQGELGWFGRLIHEKSGCGIPQGGAGTLRSGEVAQSPSCAPAVPQMWAQAWEYQRGA